MCHIVAAYHQSRETKSEMKLKILMKIRAHFSSLQLIVQLRQTVETRT